MMTLQSLLAIVGGTSGLLCFIYWILSKKRRTCLKGKVVLITGANSGLGKACAEMFHQRGCQVILAGRDIAQLSAVQEQLKQRSSEPTGGLAILQVDLSDHDALEQIGSKAKALFGRVDVLVNNAGMSSRGSIEETDLDVHKRLMNVNYFGQIALTKAILELMKETGSGHIVAISSIQGRLSQAYRSAYSASKHAMQAYFDCLRAELWNTNIHVCVVSPGYIQTNLSKNAMCGDGSSYGVMDTTTASGYAPERVASIIADAIETHRDEVMPASVTHKLAVIIRPLFPQLLFRIMEKRAKKQIQATKKDS